MKAIIIPADLGKRLRQIDLPSGEDALEAMQKLLGGYIQTHPTPRPLMPATCYFNEEGKILNLPYNLRATALFGALGLLLEGDYIAGDMILVGTDGQGNDQDCSLSLTEVTSVVEWATQSA